MESRNRLQNGVEITSRSLLLPLSREQTGTHCTQQRVVVDDRSHQDLKCPGLVAGLNPRLCCFVQSTLIIRTN
jgi:hypothetical protein